MNGKHVMWFDLILDSLYYHTASVLNYIDAIVIAFIYEKKLRLAIPFDQLSNVHLTPFSNKQKIRQ